MTETKKKPESLASLIIVLFVVSLITALLLGLVNFVTADKIIAIKAENTALAMNKVLEADEYVQVEYTGSDAIVSGVYQAIKGGEVIGHVVTVEPIGFAGIIYTVVGIDSAGVVSGVEITGMVETSGLGTEAYKPEFRAQYVGGTGDFVVNKDGGTIDALTGATVSTRAITVGINSAVSAANAMA